MWEEIATTKWEEFQIACPQRELDPLACEAAPTVILYHLTLATTSWTRSVTWPSEGIIHKLAGNVYLHGMAQENDRLVFLSCKFKLEILQMAVVVALPLKTPGDCDGSSHNAGTLRFGGRDAGTSQESQRGRVEADALRKPRHGRDGERRTESNSASTPGELLTLVPVRCPPVGVLVPEPGCVSSWVLITKALFLNDSPVSLCSWKPKRFWVESPKTAIYSPQEFVPKQTLLILSILTPLRE